MRLLTPGWIGAGLLAAGALALHLMPPTPLHAELAARAFPEVPAALAPGPAGGRVRIALLPSAAHVEQVRSLVDPRAVALFESGALVRMDGRVWASQAGSARRLLARLGWGGLAADLTETDPQAALALAAERSRVSALRRAHFGLYAALQSARDRANEHVLAATLILLASGAFACWRIARLAGRARRRLAAARPPGAPATPGTAWSERPGGLPGVKVVLVADRAALDAVRTAIGDQHILASTRDAFAFAHGWILAVRANTVWQLVSELGWGGRRLRLWEPGEQGRPEPLSVIEALHLAGSVAHP